MSEDFIMHFSFDDAKDLVGSISTEGQALLESGDMAQGRIGRIMSIFGSLFSAVLDGIGGESWNKLTEARQSDDPDTALAAFRGRPGDGMNAAAMPIDVSIDPSNSTGVAGAPDNAAATDAAGVATGATGNDGTIHPASFGDGNKPGSFDVGTPQGDAGGDVNHQNASN